MAKLRLNQRLNMMYRLETIERQDDDTPLLEVEPLA